MLIIALSQLVWDWREGYQHIDIEKLYLETSPDSILSENEKKDTGIGRERERERER